MFVVDSKQFVLIIKNEYLKIKRFAVNINKYLWVVDDRFVDLLTLELRESPCPLCRTLGTSARVFALE